MIFHTKPNLKLFFFFNLNLYKEWKCSCDLSIYDNKKWTFFRQIKNLGVSSTPQQEKYLLSKSVKARLPVVWSLQPII